MSQIGSWVCIFWQDIRQKMRRWWRSALHRQIPKPFCCTLLVWTSAWPHSWQPIPLAAVTAPNLLQMPNGCCQIQHQVLICVTIMCHCRRALLWNCQRTVSFICQELMWPDSTVSFFVVQLWCYFYNCVVFFAMPVFFLVFICIWLLQLYLVLFVDSSMCVHLMNLMYTDNSTCILYR